MLFEIYPEKVDVSILQGQKISVKPEANSDSVIHQISHDSKLFNIRLDSENGLGCETVRPIIRNSIGASSCLGPKFSGIISLEQTFSELQAEITDDVPVILIF